MSGGSVADNAAEALGVGVTEACSNERGYRPRKGWAYVLCRVVGREGGREGRGDGAEVI